MGEFLSVGPVAIGVAAVMSICRLLALVYALRKTAPADRAKIIRALADLHRFTPTRYRLRGLSAQPPGHANPPKAYREDLGKTDSGHG